MKYVVLTLYAFMASLLLVMALEVFRIGKMVNKLNERVYSLEVELTSQMYTGRIGERVK